MDLDHQRRMDRVYGQMKYIYDATRPFFLAGRRQLREAVPTHAPRRVLEVGCGTARNLILLAKRCPQASLTGIDISSEMLSLARSKVAASSFSSRITLIEAELADFAATNPAPFDDILFSYSLSMIPDWQTVLHQAIPLIAPNGGQLVIADFGACKSWPRLAQWRLYKNLSYFHVTPRPDLADVLQRDLNLTVTQRTLFGGYAQIIIAQPTTRATQ